MGNHDLDYMKHKLFYLLSFLPIIVFCQPWQQDLTFDDDGIVITDIDDGNNRVFGIVPQSNGEIIAVGNALSGENYEICLVKYHSNG